MNPIHDLSNTIIPAAPDLSIKKLCITGQYFATGSATSGVRIDNPKESELAGLLGQGSLLYKVCKNLYDATKGNQPFSIIPLADPISGIAATATQNLGGTATKNGILVLEVGHLLVRHSFVTGDTGNAILVAIKALIDADNDFLATCSNVTGTAPAGIITLTFVHKGEVGNGTKVTMSITNSEGYFDNCGLTYTSVVRLSGGTGVSVANTLLAETDSLSADVYLDGAILKDSTFALEILEDYKNNFGVKAGLIKTKALFFAVDDKVAWDNRIDGNEIYSSPYLNAIYAVKNFTGNDQYRATLAQGSNYYLEAFNVFLMRACVLNPRVQINGTITNDTVITNGNIRNAPRSFMGWKIPYASKNTGLFKARYSNQSYSQEQIKQFSLGKITVAGQNENGDYVLLTDFLTTAKSDMPLLRYSGAIDIIRFLNVSIDDMIKRNYSNKSLDITTTPTMVAADIKQIVNNFANKQIINSVEYPALLRNEQLQTMLSSVNARATQNNTTQAPDTIVYALNIATSSPLNYINGLIAIAGGVNGLI